MSYPHSFLFPGDPCTVVISGPHIQVINSTNGDILYSSTAFSEELKNAIKKSGAVRCAAVDSSMKHLAIAGEDKMLKLWKIDGLRLLNERELPKKPTGVSFTSDGQTILVSDKFGDIFSYPFEYVPLTVKQKKDALSSHENPSGGQLILGHASPLNAFILSPDEKYIITADRDEHVRVSWYPEGYTIEMYCLGHLKFVSAVHIPKFDTKTLISAGGDPMLKMWDWMTGVVKHEVIVSDAVLPYIVVSGARRKRGENEEGGEGSAPRRKRKGKGKFVNAAASTSEDVAPPNLVEAKSDETPTDVNLSNELPEKVLVIHRVSTLETTSGQYILFSAVGATAAFMTPYVMAGEKSAISHFDFGIPVIDFVVRDDQSVWVTLDAGWEAREMTTDRRMVRVLRVVEGELREAGAEPNEPLLDAVNTTAIIPATESELKELDLYSDLVAMPKYSEGDGGDGVSVEGSSKGQEGKSKKELGRLKSKQAVMAVLNEGNVEEEREMKRSRSSVDE